MFEAQMSGKPLSGEVSQSAQFAVSCHQILGNNIHLTKSQPFNQAYHWDNSTAYMILGDPTKSHLNGFVGNIIQQAASVVTKTNQRCYELVEDCYSIYAFEVRHLITNVY